MRIILRFVFLSLRFHLSLVVTASFALFSPTASATSSSGIAYHGRILKADGSPLEGNAVQFKMQIRSPGAESCLLYEEVQTLNMTGSSGVFSISMNDGSGIRSDNSGIPFNNVFSNRNGFTLPSGTCSAGSSYTPNTADNRSFVVAFKDENMQAFELLPAQAINFAPTAIQALQIAGFGPNNLLRVDDTTAAANTSPLSNVQFNALMAVANGTAPYVSSTATGGAMLPVLASPPLTPASGSLWYNSATNTLQFYNGSATQSLGTSSSSGTVTSVGTGTGLSGGPITSSGTLSLATFGSAGTYFKVVTDSTGRVASGSTALAATDIPTLTVAGSVSGSALTSGTIAGSTSVNTSGSITTTATITGANVTATTLSTNSLRLFNSANTFKATLTVPALTSDYTLVFPMTAGSNGYALTTDGSGNLSWSAVSGAPSGAASGDLSGTYPSPTVAKLSGTALSVSALTTGNFLRYSGSAWVNSNLSAADMPSLTSGQNGVLPIANGGTGTSTGSITGTGALGFAAGGTNQNVTLTPSGTGYTLLNGNVGIGTTAPYYMLDVQGANSSLGSAVTNRSSTVANFPSMIVQNFDGSGLGGNPVFNFIGARGSSASPVASIGGDILGAVQGYGQSSTTSGNYNRAAFMAFTAAANFTSSSSPGNILFETAPAGSTSATERMRISSSGNVGVGTTIPIAPLHVFSNAASVAAPATTGSTQSLGQIARFGHGAASAVAMDVGSSSTTGMWLQVVNTGNLANNYAMWLNPNGGNVGVGTTSPGATLDVNGGIRAGAATVVTATCSSTTEGIERYNYGTHYKEYCNGTNWIQFVAQAAGTTTPTSVSGPPVGASVYSFSTATANYTPGFGSVSNTDNGNWPASGGSASSNINCVELDTQSATTDKIVYDLGSSKVIGNVYMSAGGNYSGSMTPAVSFSLDNVTYTSSFTANSFGGGPNIAYAAFTLGTAVTARYVRITNVSSATSGSVNSTFCQLAVGP